MLKNDPHVFTGMRRDSSISKQQPQYLYDAKNLRFTARSEDTLMSITNERGPQKITSLKGIYLGHCVLGDYLVVFTHDVRIGAETPDRIYRISKSGGSIVKILLYEGNLNFQSIKPIDTVGYYELENLQKVYWIDGLNRPRVINIKRPELLDLIGNDGNYKDHKSFLDALVLFFSPDLRPLEISVSDRLFLLRLSSLPEACCA